MVFDQLKKINELRKLQGDMKKEKIVVEKRGVTVEMNGEFAVENIKLNPELGIDDQQETLKQC
ncbi:MAG: YbaB/EbfC family nucleoid-associated protein, partial [Candidatus Staskawiczbacteria bacterium]